MKTMITIVMLLISVSQVFSAPNVKLYSDLEFSDKSIQQRAYNLPTCASGEVYVNKAGSLFCGSLMPIDRGIAICVSGACSLSACMQGYGDCDGSLTNGCEAVIGTIQNCSCGISCTPQNECVTPSCANGACQFTNVIAGTLTSQNITGNCKKNICDGNGNITNITDNTNIPNDNNPCTTDTCINGVPTYALVVAGTVCPAGICNGSGQCIPNPVCGNGIVEAGEQCDDGNNDAGDGCAPNCIVEPFNRCFGSPSVCGCIGLCP
jgi:cysteine-rich repeat protein